MANGDTQSKRRRRVRGMVAKRRKGPSEDQSNGRSVQWRARTPQEEGRRTEKEVLKDAGARSHPNSGAGSIKYDGSTDDEVIEVKEARLVFALRGDYLSSLWKHSVRRSKKPIMIIRFKNGIEARIEISKVKYKL